MHRRHSLHTAIIQQAGREVLVLNDLILGDQGSRLLSSLLPSHFSNIKHLQLRGNNISSQGFQLIFTALLQCHSIQSLHLEWNSLGNSGPGLTALCTLVAHSPRLTILDIKNNRITSGDPIAEILCINSPSLTHLQLRFNEMGDRGGKVVLNALNTNHYITYLGVEDNRLSKHTMQAIRDSLVNRRAPPQRTVLNNITNTLPEEYPLSGDAYGSLDEQWRNAQLRSKLETEQQEHDLYTEKINIEIQKQLNKLRLKTAQAHESQLRIQSLQNEHLHTINQLREAERILMLSQERYASIQSNLNHDLCVIRQQKAELNSKMQEESERRVLSNENELREVSGVMESKHDKMQKAYRERLNELKQTREKHAELMEDVLKHKLIGEALWDRTPTTSKSAFEEKMQQYREAIAKTEADNRMEMKKGSYVGAELTTMVMKGLDKEETIEKEIYDIQCRIKKIHQEMTVSSVEIELQDVKSNLLMDTERNKEIELEIKTKILKHVQAQNIINQEIEKCRGEENRRGDKIIDDTIEFRMRDVEGLLRSQLAQNTMIRNQYEKLVNLLETATKRTLQNIIFQQ